MIFFYWQTYTRQLIYLVRVRYIYRYMYMYMYMTDYYVSRTCVLQYYSDLEFFKGLSLNTTLTVYSQLANFLKVESRVLCLGLAIGLQAPGDSHLLKYPCISSLFLAEWPPTVAITLWGLRNWTNCLSSEKLLCSL